MTGGNVSFYNQTGTTPILPTPVVGVMGVIDDVTRRTPVGFAAEGDAVYLLGETRDELDGSAWADVVHDHLGGRPPQVDLAHEQRLARVLVQASRDGLLRSAHDLSDGGLAQALVESCLRRDHGVEVTLPEGADPFVALFSESAGRVLVSLDPDAEQGLRELCESDGRPAHPARDGDDPGRRDRRRRRPVQPPAGPDPRRLGSDDPRRPGLLSRAPTWRADGRSARHRATAPATGCCWPAPPSR